MEMTTFEYLLQAQQPIAHHSETIGNINIFMRRPIRQPDGTITQEPIITADSMRHQIRSYASRQLLNTIGLDKISESALRLLFNGGVVAGASGGGVSIKNYRETSRILPHIALLGGCVNNRIVNGKLSVQDARLVSKESIHICPKWVQEQLFLDGVAIQHSGEYLEETTRVRFDPMKFPETQKYLEGATEDTDKSSMLPRQFECVIAGSLFYWRIDCAIQNELDKNTILHILDGFFDDLRAGGKQATGHGLLSVYAKRVPEIESTQSIYEYYRENTQDITKFLKEVVA